MDIFDDVWLALIFRFLINLVVVVVAFLVYYPGSKGNIEYLFTYISALELQITFCFETEPLRKSLPTTGLIC